MNTILLIIAIVFAVLAIILGFTTWNLLRKNEKMEEAIESYTDYIKNVTETLGVIEARLNQIDERGTFKSDDEIGFFFDRIKTLYTALKVFKVEI